VACPCADADNFLLSYDKKFSFDELSRKEKKTMLAMMASVFFFLQESSPKQNVFVPGW
jgi:hypothetical protein